MKNFVFLMQLDSYSTFMVININSLKKEEEKKHYQNSILNDNFMTKDKAIIDRHENFFNIKAALHFIFF